MPTPAVFAALASPVRRRILELLLDGPRAASDIASEFQLNRPAVSEHVHVLRSANLVREEARGRQRYYHLNPAPLADVGDWLRPFERYLALRMRALKEALDKEDQA
jgi:DNA-binding transcriptional ArsR family regulator